MKVALVFQLLSLLCSLKLQALPVAAPPSPPSTLAKPDCPNKCGNVTIPFPFGIGKRGCFLDDWYEIVCRPNDGIPWLRKINLQVQKISVPNRHFNSTYRYYPLARGTVDVNLPISYSSESCSHKNSGVQPRNLDGSPFVYSDKNSFFAVGCDRLAVVNRSDLILAGCKSRCTRGTFNEWSACTARDGCCKAGISPSFLLQEFRLDFLKEFSSGNDKVKECSLALFLANESWFQPGRTNLHDLLKGGHAPGVLEWGILNDTELAGQLYKTCPYQESTSCSYDNLTGSALDSPKRQIYSFYCTAGFDGNAYLKDGCKDVDECQDPNRNKCPHACVNTRGSFHCKDSQFKPIMIGLCSSLGPLVFIFLAWWMYKLIKKRREAKLREKYFKRNGGLILQQQLSSPEGNVEKSKLFDSKELEKATDHFNKNRILGIGGQGTVYKGMLTDGRIVAIKKSLAIDGENVAPFINEVVILSQINHRNVVKLLGCCLESEVPLLVYEFIPNGTLYEYLHDEEFPVSWEARLRIATEVAGALFYLHSSASIPIYHRDIKSSNILLDEKYRAKIADFGTSRSVPLDQTHVTTLVQGTFGYLDPEYFQSSQFTDKSDVYSFGVVLVELLTGQKPVSSLRAIEGRSLATYFIISMEENHLFDILDARLLEQGRAEEITAVANLAKRCLNLKGRKRPTMKEVAIELEGIRNPLPPPSSLEQNQEKSHQIEVEKSGEDNGWVDSGGSEMGADIITLSDAHPLLPSETW